MILCDFGSFSVQSFQGIYNVFAAFDVKEHKLILIPIFGSNVLACARSKAKGA